MSIWVREFQGIYPPPFYLPCKSQKYLASQGTTASLPALARAESSYQLACTETEAVGSRARAHVRLPTTSCSVLLGSVQAQELDIWVRYCDLHNEGVIDVQLQRTKRNGMKNAQAMACVERCQYRLREVEGSVMGTTGCKHWNVRGYALESFWVAGEWNKSLAEPISHEVIEENKQDIRSRLQDIDPEVSRQAHDEWAQAGLRSPENATRWAHERLASPTISLRRITPVALAL
ncbi:hypothetical protein BKA83DRAFT_4126574 [Pisolithus microcarpus]|nr:hypothetical protein BKA83DRAFT_4126574 [Pisolithus microcarpus]